ncbi:MAG TPA: DUF2786 domain-containing protein [Candidatus Acidoferrum sp.]|nr:DUF2786 domain-containing protein [Candidatus Acidoferrum sp.]
MTRDEVIEKIKKLLRMKRGGTQAEIETALNLARELAEKHNVDLAGVNPDDEQTQRERPIGHEDAISGARIQWESKYAGLIAQTYFNVNIFVTRLPNGRLSLRMVGTDWDRQISIYVFRFLCGHFRREWKSRRGRCRNRQAFMFGMYRGICVNLDAKRDRSQNANAVLVVERALVRRNQYIAEHFGEMKSTDTHPGNDAQEALNRGYRAGRETQINKGVKAGEQRAAAALGTNQQGQLLLG